MLPFLGWLSVVNRETLRADFMAAITGAVIVLPQGVAFAMIAGLPPQYGLYTAIVTPVVAALFGSSWHLISGPTTAISIVVFSAVSNHAVPGTPEFIQITLTLTFLAGVYQLAFGLARMGTLVNFVSHSVVVGFTAGAAILIATSQIKGSLGLDIPSGVSFLHTWRNMALAVGDTNLAVLTVSGITLATALVIKKVFPRGPNLLIAMVVGALTSLWLGGETVGIPLIGKIPGHLPPLSAPDLSIETIRELAPEAFAVALLGLIEAVSIGRSVATKSQQRIDGSQEFIGQGLSNIVGSFFSSYAGSGSFTRTGVNYQAGARTPMAAIMAAGLLAGIVLLIAPLTAYLPIPAMAGIILLVAYNLIDIHHVRIILRASRSETAVLITTFVATLLLDLEFAIYAGVLLSLIFYLNKTAHPSIVSIAPDPGTSPKRFNPSDRHPSRKCPQLEILRIDGSIFFGSADDLARRLRKITDFRSGAKWVMLVCNGVNVIDVSGAELLAQEAERLRKAGGGLYISGLKTREMALLRSGRYLAAIGRDNVSSSKTAALHTIIKNLDKSRCETCVRRVFMECPTQVSAPIVDQPEPSVSSSSSSADSELATTESDAAVRS